MVDKLIQSVVSICRCIFYILVPRKKGNMRKQWGCALMTREKSTSVVLLWCARARMPHTHHLIDVHAIWDHRYVSTIFQHFIYVLNCIDSKNLRKHHKHQAWYIYTYRIERDKTSKRDLRIQRETRIQRGKNPWGDKNSKRD